MCLGVMLCKLSGGGGGGGSKVCTQVGDTGCN